MQRDQSHELGLDFRGHILRDAADVLPSLSKQGVGSAIGEGVGSERLVAAGVLSSLAEKGQADGREHENGEEPISSIGIAELWSYSQKLCFVSRTKGGVSSR